MTTAKEIIVEMMGKMPAWHDYPDDPPKEFGEYVVLIADGIEESFDIGEYGEGYTLIDGKWSTIIDWGLDTSHVECADEFSMVDGIRVTHWMPFPQPPKEE